MMSLQTYVNQSRHALHQWSTDHRVRMWVKGAAHTLSGFCLSAASLGNVAQPLSLGLVCALGGAPALLTAIGSCIGYLTFWGIYGLQGLLWILLGLMLLPIQLQRLSPGLLPWAAASIAAISGLVFQLLGLEQLSILLYFLRIGVAFGSAWVFSAALADRVPPARWFAGFGAVLAFAQIAPIPVLCLGFPVAGALMVAAPFPAAALAGLALDLAQITPVPMTGVLALGGLLRFLPRYPKWLSFMGPGIIFTIVMSLRGTLDLTPIPGLMLGGFIGGILPTGTKPVRRRGEAGILQVQLELVAGVLSQTQQLLLQVPENPVDEQGLIHTAAERACSGCSNRNACKDQRKLENAPVSLLEKPLYTPEELHFACKKSGRFLAELHRSREQLRAIRANHRLQAEYRAAVSQQYSFLAEYLQDLSDNLINRNHQTVPVYKPEILVFNNRPESDNGDLCLRFPGPGDNYYVILCDGMGTGIGAVQQSRSTGSMLRRLLTAGFPPEHALRSVNSLCALRERAGAVTIDLAQLNLSTGRAALYKWGAMPSYIVRKDGADPIGAPCPPPGLSVTEHREESHKCSLKKGELLVLISDGAHDHETLRRCNDHKSSSPGTLGRSLMAHCRVTAEDDATVVIIRLNPQ